MLALALVAAVSTPAGAEPAPRSLAIATPAHPPTDAGLCAAHAVADRLSEALHGAAPGWVVLDRALVRALTRETGDVQADVVLRFEVLSGARGLTLAAVDAPLGLGPWSLDDLDVGALAAEIAGRVLDAAAAASPARRVYPPPRTYPTPLAACAGLARAWAGLDARDPPGLAAARRALTAALRLAPADPRLEAALAEVEAREGRPEAAATRAARARAVAPELATADWALGLAHDLAGNEAEALAAYDRAAAAGVAGARVNAGLVALRGGELAAALARLEDVVALAPAWPLARLNLAAALLEAGDGRAALDVLAGVPADGPLALPRRLLEAEARILAGPPAEAVAFARALHGEGVAGAWALVLLARAHTAGESAAAAPDLLAPWIEAREGVSDRARASALVAYARGLAQLGRAAEGLAAAERYAAALSAREARLVARARALLATPPDLSGLLAHVAEAPDDHEAWYAIGVLRHAADPAAAAVAYERAAALNPRASWARYNRGLLALEGGDAATAATWLDAAAALEPSAADVARALAIARARLAEAP